MTPIKTPLRAAALGAVLAWALPALATNGMNMEGYGPISTGMGGASQAIDHGTAAMAQNPATLALMASPSRLDVALGVLGPRIESSVATPMGTMSSESDGTSYVMPAFGYVRRTGPWTYGIGVFAQGGMGTEYDANSFLASGSGQPVRSELAVGRVLLPVAYQATPELALGATFDIVWAGLDMRLAAPGAQLGQLVTGASGNLGAALPALAGASWARIDFSDGSDFTGKANSIGWAAKLGAVYKATPEVTLGASYQFKTNLDDMKTGSTGASLSAEGGFVDSGRITVIDFQWPATLGAGIGWQATPALLVAADIKRLQWSDVMKDFKLRFDSAGLGGSVSFALPQNWEDQTVFNLGVAYDVNAQLTLRGGLNLADNPVPDAYVNPLFPATIEDHYTLGLGYRFSPASEFNGSFTYAPTVTVTNPQGIEISHKQVNWQFMYTHRF